MQSSGIKTNLCMLVATVLAGGCSTPNGASTPTQMLLENAGTKTEMMQAAQEVLLAMSFPIEKFDVEQGLIRTWPLRGAQFFELWRRDNASGFDAAEANLQTVRRTVELHAGTPFPGASGLRLNCTVTVQRLSLPENQIPSISQMYRMHSQSTPTTQRLAVTPQQQRAMAWLDLGTDPQLEAKILQRIEQRLRRTD